MQYHNLVLTSYMAQFTIDNMSTKFNSPKLSAEIARAGITQREIAETMGIHHNTVSGWANGRPPHPEKLYKVLRLLGWDTEQLKNERLSEWYLMNGES